MASPRGPPRASPRSGRLERRLCPGPPGPSRHRRRRAQGAQGPPPHLGGLPRHVGGRPGQRGQ
eukprot:3755688-Lingulodinium_polyedra.AAC.1